MAAFAKVPFSYKIDGYNLGNWVGNQRANKDQITPDRLERLGSLGFVWDALDAAWEEGFEQLQRYVAENGDAKVPQSYKIDGFDLGNWVSRQRRKKDQLTPDRLNRLGALAGWVWSAR